MENRRLMCLHCSDSARTHGVFFAFDWRSRTLPTCLPRTTELAYKDRRRHVIQPIHGSLRFVKLLVGLLLLQVQKIRRLSSSLKFWPSSSIVCTQRNLQQFGRATWQTSEDEDVLPDKPPNLKLWHACDLRCSWMDFAPSFQAKTYCTWLGNTPGPSALLTATNNLLYLFRRKRCVGLTASAIHCCGHDAPRNLALPVNRTFPTPYHPYQTPKSRLRLQKWVWMRAQAQN